MFGWFADWIQKRQRRYDLECLWPICKQQASGHVELARLAFLYHMGMSEHWRSLALDEEELSQWVRQNLV